MFDTLPKLLQGRDFENQKLLVSIFRLTEFPTYFYRSDPFQFVITVKPPWPARRIRRVAKINGSQEFFSRQTTLSERYSLGRKRVVLP